MRYLLLLLTLFIFSQQADAQRKGSKPVADKRLAGLDTALQKLLGDWHAAGFAVVIVEKDKLVYSKGFGYRDWENKKPVTPNTLFAIGSSTKAFTSALVGLLEKQGTLKLDDPVTKHLPTLRFYNDEMNAQVTIRDMMSHRTGLPRHDFSWYLFSTESRDSLAQRIQYQEPSAGIRERWQYNNFMFLLQGMLAEKYSGKSWEMNIREKFLTPLGMKRSVTSIKEMEKDEDAAKGYMVKNDSIIKHTDYYHIDAMGPAGSINSSVHEMANWVISWIQGGKFNGKEILPASYVQQAMSSQMVVSGGLPGSPNPDLHMSNYGLGWFLSSYRGHYRVEHGGNIDGFSANVAFFPSDSIGIVVLTNQNGSNIPNIARNIIADRMLRLPYINWNGQILKNTKEAQAKQKEAQATAKSNRKEGTKPSHPLSDYEGIYQHPGYGSIEIYLEKDSLLGRAGKEKLYLRHYHYDVFDLKGYDKMEGLDTSAQATGPRIVFQSDESGRISLAQLQLEPTLEPLEFEWKPRSKPLDAEALKEFTGDYDLSGLTVKVYVKNESLYVLVPGQPDYECAFMGNDQFSLKKLTGYSVKFNRDENKAVKEMQFIQPNGIFTATKKKKENGD